jgi:protein required for attachment to host cells
MPTCWVMVSNGARGVLYSADAQFQKMTEMRQFEHPESRVKARDIYSDDRGRTRGYGNGPRHAMDPDTEPKRIQMQNFAREIGEALRAGRVKNQYDNLVIVAPPRFLGLLREQLDTDTGRMVAEEIPHDWTSIAQPRDLAERIREVIPMVR